jgi:hypothetical protein
METLNEAVTCHWLTPTWLMPAPYRTEAAVRPWSCLRDDCVRPVDLAECDGCSRWERRTFESARRDLIFETWGTGDFMMKPRSFDEARRQLVLDTWGVE